MKQGLHYISCLLMAMLTLVSCAGDDAIDDDSSANSGASETVQITFTINMGSTTSSSASRTTWGEGYTSFAATDFENSIKSLVVLFYDLDGNLISALDDLSYVRRTADNENNIYDITGRLEVRKTKVTNNKLPCKIIVLANYDASKTLIWRYKEGSKDDTAIDSDENFNTLSGVGNIIFKYEDGDGKLRECLKDQSMGIPMYGVKEYTNGLTLVSGIQTDAGTIYMLRSMAKVRLVSQVSGYTVKSVTIKNFDKKGYIAPAAYTATDTRNIDYDTTTGGSYNCYKDNDTKSNLSFIEDTDGSYYIYVPETGADEEAVITVSFNETTTTKTFNVGNYTNGKQSEDNWINLVRNHVYTYTIVNMKEVTLQYQAMEWDDKGGTVTFD